MSERYTPEQMAENADWGQVVCNGGPPCFHADGNRFCLRAERWPGHAGSYEADHKFVSLAELLRSQAATDAEALAAKDEHIEALRSESMVMAGGIGSLQIALAAKDAEIARLTAERDEARQIVADVNNEVVGSHGYFNRPPLHDEGPALCLTGDATEGQG